MRSLNIILLFVIILFTSCSKNNFETGIKGTVEYGEGDCMPIIVPQSREYENYKGRIYFVVKSDYDNLGSGDLDSLKNESINTFIRHGKLSKELPAGTYILLVDEVNASFNERTVIITQDEILTKDLQIWKCTSY